MDLLIEIADPARINTDSVTGFLRSMVAANYIEQTAIETIHCDTLPDGAKPKDLPDSLAIIERCGVDGLIVTFAYENHYRLKGRPTGMGHLTGIMYSLNVAAGEVADALGCDVSTDFYFEISFRNRLLRTDYGEIHQCGMQFGGEGGDVDDLETGAEIIVNAMKTEYPPFGELVRMMEGCFGEVVVKLDYSEF